MANITTRSWESHFPAPAGPHTISPSTFLGMKDVHAAIILPVVGFWVVCGYFELIDYFDWFPQYRVVPSREELRRNLVGKAEVARNALTMHAIQIVFGLALDQFYPSGELNQPWGAFGKPEYFARMIENNAAQYGLTINHLWLITGAYTLRWSFLIARQLASFFIVDTWGYWVHYTLHVYPTLYRKYHAMHHQNYVPYSFAAGYNHPVEGFSDVLAAAVAVKVVGLSDRESIYFYTIAALKAVDDHSGLTLPFSPFRLWRWVFGNGPVFHTIHHQRWGFKTNFEIFFCFWDYMNGTLYKGSRLPGESWEKKYKDGEAEYEAKKKDN